jgi:hypothetical protein
VFLKTIEDGVIEISTEQPSPKNGMLPHYSLQVSNKLINQINKHKQINKQTDKKNKIIINKNK